MRLLLVLAICLLFLGAADSFAEILEPGHSWGIGTEVSSIKYTEPDIMSERGIMYGVDAFYNYYGELSADNPELNKWMIRAEGRASMGQVDYKNSGDIDSIDDSIIELRGLGGYGLEVSESVAIIPYIGVGYRQLNDDMGGHVSSNGSLGYDRESKYLYAPIGAEAILDLKNSWSVGLSAEYDYFMWGRQISRLSQVRNDYNDPENHQKSGFGLRSALRVEKKGEAIDFMIEAFVRFWSIKRSQEADLTFNGFRIGTATEPKNRSTEYGLKAALKF